MQVWSWWDELFYWCVFHIQTDKQTFLEWVGWSNVSSLCERLTPWVGTYFSHDSNGCLSFSLGHPVLYQVVHILIIQQADQVKGAKTGSAAQSQVSDDHRTGEKPEEKHKMYPQHKTNSFFSCMFIDQGFFPLTCRRTSWAGRSLQPSVGRQDSARTALAPGRRHYPAR